MEPIEQPVLASLAVYPFNFKYKPQILHRDYGSHGTISFVDFR